MSEKLAVSNSNSKQPPIKLKRGIQMRKSFPWLLLAPTIIVLAFLGLFPFIYAIRLAGTNIILSKPYLPRIFMGLGQIPGRSAGSKFYHRREGDAYFYD